MNGGNKKGDIMETKTAKYGDYIQGIRITVTHDQSGDELSDAMKRFHSVRRLRHRTAGRI